MKRKRLTRNSPHSQTPMTPDELRAKLGMTPGQLLTNTNGQLADILEVRGQTVILGIIDTGKTVEVPLCFVVKEKPNLSTN